MSVSATKEREEKVRSCLKHYKYIALAASLLIVLALSWTRCIEVRENITIFPMSIFSSLNPMIIMFAVLIFTFFTSLQLVCNHCRLQEYLILFAKDSYWIYLLHAIVIELLIKVLGKLGGGVFWSSICGNNSAD